MLAVRSLVLGTEINSLHRPQDIARRENHDRGRKHGEHITELPHGEDHEHFADEAAQAGQSQASEENQNSHRSVVRHFAENAAELGQVAMMHSVVQHADHKEHAG